MSGSSSISKIHLQGAFQLPKIMRQFNISGAAPTFTRDDVNKIIEHIINKGNKYAEFKKKLGQNYGTLLDQRITKSSYMQFAIRKQLDVMGDQRRIGSNLRGFSKLLLEEFQQKSWLMIEIQTALLFKQKEEKFQREKLERLLNLNSDQDETRA